jgi:hypothetical protein
VRVVAERRWISDCGGEEAAVAEDSGGPGQGGRGTHNLVSVWVVGGVRRLEGSQKRKARQKPTGGRRSMGRQRSKGTRNMMNGGRLHAPPITQPVAR